MVFLVNCIFLVLFRCIFFSGLHFYTLSKTPVACRDMQLSFFSVKTWLNNAFKYDVPMYQYLLNC